MIYELYFYYSGPCGLLSDGMGDKIQRQHSSYKECHQAGKDGLKRSAATEVAKKKIPAPFPVLRAFSGFVCIPQGSTMEPVGFIGSRKDDAGKMCKWEPIQERRIDKQSGDAYWVVLDPTRCADPNCSNEIASDIKNWRVSADVDGEKWWKYVQPESAVR